MPKPLVLCHVQEYSGIPSFLLELILEHFDVVTEADFKKNPCNFSSTIVAVISANAQPKVTNELLQQLSNLKIVASCSAGVNHIDVKMVNSYNVKVSNTPDVLDDTVADMGMLLLMAAGRNLVDYLSVAQSPDVVEFPTNKICEQDIHHSTLGIIGMGQIGYKIAKRARGFDMKILYHNRNRRSVDVEETVQATFYEKLADMLPLCDFVIVSVCLTPATTKMIGEAQFKLMKSSAVFINISRGAVVHHDALIKALSSNEIHFAALDVTDPEPLPRDHPLLKMPNVIITPHCSSASLATRKRMMRKTIDNVLAALEGRTLPSEVII